MLLFWLTKRTIRAVSNTEVHMHTIEKRPVGIVTFYVWRHKLLLLLRDDVRDKPKIAFPNTWTPITGGVEEGEDVTAAAAREGVEEGGISTRLMLIGVSVKGNGFFFGKLSDVDARDFALGEGRGFGFFTHKEIAAMHSLGWIGGAFNTYFTKYPRVFERMLEDMKAPKAEELGLAAFKR